MKKIFLICNLTSGAGRGIEPLEKIKNWATTQDNLDLNIFITKGPGHATEITKSLTTSNQNCNIISMGGDGTLNEIINGIVNFSTTNIGILPYGSGNDFARSMQINKLDPVATINSYINDSTTKKIDYFLLNNKYKAINAINLGITTDINIHKNKMKRFKPETKYKLSVLKAALAWKLYSYNLSIDGNNYIKIKSPWFSIANGAYAGGGITIAPNAKIDDGYISVSWLKQFNHIFTLYYFSKIIKGQIAQIKQINFFNCKELCLKFPQKETVEFDGVLIDNQTECNVKIIHKGLSFFLDTSTSKKGIV